MPAPTYIAVPTMASEATSRSWQPTLSVCTTVADETLGEETLGKVREVVEDGSTARPGCHANPPSDASEQSSSWPACVPLTEDWNLAR